MGGIGELMKLFKFKNSKMRLGIMIVMMMVISMFTACTATPDQEEKDTSSNETQTDNPTEPITLTFYDKNTALVFLMNLIQLYVLMVKMST